MEVGLGEKLVHGLGAGVTPAALGGRAEHEMSVLAKRKLGAQSVDFGSRREDDALALLRRRRENDLGRPQVVFDAADRALDDQANANRRCEMEHGIDAIDELGDNRSVLDAPDRVMKAGMALEELDVSDAACREVVEHVNVVASKQTRVGKVRPDETRTAGNENTHTISGVSAVDLTFGPCPLAQGS